METLAELASSPQGEKYWSTTPNFRRTLDRVFKDYCACIRSPDDKERKETKDSFDILDDDDEHNIIKKQLQSCAEIAKA